MIVYHPTRGGSRPMEVSDEVAEALQLRHGERITTERAEYLKALMFSAHIAIGEALAIAAAGNLPDPPAGAIEGI